MDFAETGYLKGKLYSQDEVRQMVGYLERRGVAVIEAINNPGFRARNINTGRSEIHLPANPTALQVKHELSHWLDCKRLGVEKYSQLSILEKEQMVLDRLKNNRVWQQLNIEEKAFSEQYVENIKIKNILANKME